MVRDPPIALCFPLSDSSNIEKFQKKIANKGKALYGATFNPIKLSPENDFPISGYISNKNKIIAKCIISKIIPLSSVQNPSDISEYRIVPTDNDEVYNIINYLELSSMEKLAEPFQVTNLKKYGTDEHLAGSPQGFAYVNDDYYSNDKIWKLSELTTFIETEMNMQYNYQAVMLMSLLKCPNFTASRNLLREQLGRYNGFAKDYAEPLREAIVATSETKDRAIVSKMDGDQIKLNLEPVDQDLKNELIEICYDKIAEWDSKWTLIHDGSKEKINDDARFFLLLPNEKGSVQLLENSYTHDGWSQPGDQKPKKYGEVKEGDIILVYFAAKSVMHAKLLKTAYKVSKVSENHETLDLKPIKDLFGITYQKIQELINTNKIGTNFKSVGQPLNFTEISRNDYRDVLSVDYKLKPTVNENDFASADSKVKKIMNEHSKGPFANLTAFIKSEKVEGYKGKILKNAENIFKNENSYIENLKVACSQRIVGNHIFRFVGGPEESEARILYAITEESEEVQQEFKEKLRSFFESVDELEFGNRWDSLVSLMRSIKSSSTRPDFLFLCYLAFLQNPKLHFPFTPTRADALFEFFGIPQITSGLNGDKTWRSYEMLLELANELRLKLADNPELDLIDVQGYMWVLGSALQKGIKDDGGVEDVSDSIDTSEFEDILEYKSQMILYGPPGTGKTYTAKKIAESFTGKEFEDMQLHHQCFLALGGWSNWSHTIQNGPLRWGVDPSTPSNLGVYNSVEEGDYVVFYQNKDEPAKFTQRGMFGIGRVTRKYTSEEPYWPDEVSAGNAIYTHRFELEPLKISRDDDEMIPWIDGLPFTKGLNSIKNEEVLAKLLSEIQRKWNLSLGCSFIKRITFHQSFSYEEFIEGIKAEAHGTSVSFDVSPGIFKEFCNCARRNPKQKFVMIIDEINRGNIPKILGEIITLLEKDKREDTTTLPYSKESFSVPKNVFIIGTMNTADRSLVLLDVALRRRFAFYEIMPDPLLLKNKDVEGVDLTKLLDSINNKIKNQDMRDYQIGHSYFMKGEDPIETEAELFFAMVYEVIPLVKEYFYNEQKKIDDVLGKDLGSPETKTDWRKNSKKLVESLKIAFPESKVN